MSKRTTFWAEDDSDDLMMFQQARLELDQGYNVFEFNNGRELLNNLDGLEKKDYPCLIIQDMNMPMFGGRYTVKHLKTNLHYQSIPVVVFTTSDSALDKTFCKHYGTEIKTKPTSHNHLLDTIKDMFQHCHQ